MQNEPTPSPISINPGFTGKLSPELIELIKAETKAKGLAILCLDDTMPCEQDKAGHQCTFGHRFKLTLVGVEHFNYHEALMQMLRECPGHSELLK